MRRNKRTWAQEIGERQRFALSARFATFATLLHFHAFPCISTKKVFVTVMQPRESPLQRVESFRSCHSEKDVKLVWTSLDVTGRLSLISAKRGNLDLAFRSARHHHGPRAKNVLQVELNISSLEWARPTVENNH